MAKPKKKKRQPGKRQIETALPKRQYKRTNRLLYIFSAILLVVFGGGAALLGTGAPRGPAQPAPTLAPITSNQSVPGQAQGFSATPTPGEAQVTATPASGQPSGAATPAPAQTPGVAAPATGQDQPVPATPTPAPPGATPTP